MFIVCRRIMARPPTQNAVRWLSIARAITLSIATLLAIAAHGASVTADPRPAWAVALERQLNAIDVNHSGELGVYVKDLATGATAGLRADEYWYIASGVKVPVAIAVLRNVELGEFTLDTEVLLVETDYQGEASDNDWNKPGSRRAIRFLMEQMLSYGDNTATDMLIRLIGLKQVNGVVRELVPEGFGDITTLADARRNVYSGFHPDAFRLTGKDFFLLEKHSDERRRLSSLASTLGVDAGELILTDMDSAFAAYYATNLNGARLSAYGHLLEALLDGEALGQQSTDYIIDLMLKAEAGRNRLKAGLPASVAFAHKISTQHLRACDLGVAFHRNESTAPTVITACTRGFASMSDAEAALKAVGKAIHHSGVLD